MGRRVEEVLEGAARQQPDARQAHGEPPREFPSARTLVGQEFEYGAVAFFKLQPGLMLALWPRASIARDSGLSRQPPSATEFTLGHNVGSKDDVDAVMDQARRAGAKIVKAAGATFWGGYAGYFQDPDEHVWEIVWNPHLAIAE